jgi:pimeloyl-ACP methyl ester carboxylesterase
MPTIDANGFTMYYEQGGDGVPLVYVHGGNTSLLHALHYGRRPFSWRWRQDFIDRFHFLWYERRGCYRSSAPDDGYDLETQASDLLTLLDHLGIERAHVVGMSAGGPISVVFAALQPERVRSLALVSTGLDLWSNTDPKTALVRA